MTVRRTNKREIPIGPEEAARRISPPPNEISEAQVRKLAAQVFEKWVKSGRDPASAPVQKLGNGWFWYEDAFTMDLPGIGYLKDLYPGGTRPKGGRPRGWRRNPAPKPSSIMPPTAELAMPDPPAD